MAVFPDTVTGSHHPGFRAGEPFFNLPVHFIQFLRHALKYASDQSLRREILRSDIFDGTPLFRFFPCPGKGGIYLQFFPVVFFVKYLPHHAVMVYTGYPRRLRIASEEMFQKRIRSAAAERGARKEIMPFHKRTRLDSLRRKISIRQYGNLSPGSHIDQNRIRGIFHRSQKTRLIITDRRAYRDAFITADRDKIIRNFRQDIRICARLLQNIRPETIFLCIVKPQACRITAVHQGCPPSCQPHAQIIHDRTDLRRPFGHKVISAVIQMGHKPVTCVRLYAVFLLQNPADASSCL